MVKSQTYRAISRQFQVSRQSLSRHKLHIARILRESTETAENVQRNRLGAVLQGLVDDVHRLKRQAERKRDIRAALKAIDTGLKAIELSARLAGRLAEPTQRNELHLHLPPDRALAVAEAYISRHGSGSELRFVPPAIEGEENI
jgi:hypothetical protein